MPTGRKIDTLVDRQIERWLVRWDELLIDGNHVVQKFIETVKESQCLQVDRQIGGQIYGMNY